MASIHLEIEVAAAPETVWSAIRDVGAVHTRFARDFVTDCRLEEGARVVTFASISTTTPGGSLMRSAGDR
jgi:hypothetical protein